MRDSRLARTPLLGTLALVAVALLATAQSARADILLSQGPLSVTIRSDNGAINNVLFSGAEFYRQGTFVSDFGFQVGTNTGTFSRNTANGVTGTPVTVAGTTTAVVTGIVPGTAGNVAFTRTYSLVPGLNVLRTTTTLTNNGVASATIRAFDTADPDQGNGPPLNQGFSTVNDVYSLGGFLVGRSTANGPSPFTVVFGPDGVTGFGGGSSPFVLEIGNGPELNTFFSTPFDPNGANQDIGFGFGREVTLAAGGSSTIVFDQAFGTTQANAENAFLAAQAVPEPTTMVLFGLCAVAGGGFAWRRRRAPCA